MPGSLWGDGGEDAGIEEDGLLEAGEEAEGMEAEGIRAGAASPFRPASVAVPMPRISPGSGMGGGRKRGRLLLAKVQRGDPWGAGSGGGSVTIMGSDAAAAMVDLEDEDGDLEEVLEAAPKKKGKASRGRDGAAEAEAGAAATPVGKENVAGAPSTGLLLDGDDDDRESPGLQVAAPRPRRVMRIMDSDDDE